MLDRPIPKTLPMRYECPKFTADSELELRGAMDVIVAKLEYNNFFLIHLSQSLRQHVPHFLAEI